MDRTSQGRYWSEDADNYRRIIEAEFNSFRADAWLQLFSRELPPPPAVIADFGCGPGFFSVLLSRQGYQITGIDISQKMVAAAVQNAARYIPNHPPLFLHKDDGFSSFPNDVFDAVVTRNVTWTLLKPQAFYKQCRRVLKPGGRLLVFDANWNLPMFNPAASQRVEQRLQACLQQYGSTFDGPPISEPLDVSALPLSHHLRPQWDIPALISAGFTDVVAQTDITESLWDAKEKLLYGETPLFSVYARKPKPV